MTPLLRTIIVCVDYSDLLELTLAYNRHHFEEVMIVTSFNDHKTVAVAKNLNAKIYQTNAFYTDGAVFNKFRALEEGLDVFGRYGWLCIMDADVLWPKDIPWCNLTAYAPDFSNLTKGYLYTPLRRMCVDVPDNLPHEPYWRAYPLHPQQVEWAGYTQIFHADDPHLPETTPWHQIDWKHAGGADSFFQQLWPKEYKLRPPFECMHLGPAGQNWCGRVTRYLDGTQHPLALTHHKALREFMRQRTLTKSFSSEKCETTVDTTE